MQAVILCGGLGTRIYTVEREVPKSLIQVGEGITFIDILIKFLQKNNFKEIILCVGHRQEQIIEHIEKNYKNSLSFKFSREFQQLGTGGALKNALPLLEEEFLLMNGDSFAIFDVASFLRNHDEDKNDLTILLKKIKHSERYGTVEIDNAGRITHFNEKAEIQNSLINLGIYFISKSKIKWNEYPREFSFEKDCLPKMCQNNLVRGFITDGYFIDIGIPEDLFKFREDLKKGIQ